MCVLYVCSHTYRAAALLVDKLLCVCVLYVCSHTYRAAALLVDKLLAVEVLKLGAVQSHAIVLRHHARVCLLVLFVLHERS